MLNKRFLTIYVIFAILVGSCAKSKTIDKQGEAEVKFYTNNESLGNAPQNSISYNVTNIPNVAGSGLANLSANVPANIKFPVFATKPVSKDVEITATLDNSLVATYNAENHTNYSEFPSGILNTSVLLAHISKGQTRSLDSISIVPDLAALNNLTGTAYMAPIRLLRVSDPAVGRITSSATQVAYVVMNVELRRIKYLATTADVQGTLITPRTSWTVSFNPAPTTTGSIVDGSTSTFSRWPNGSSPGTVDVNFQATKNVTGIRLYTSNQTNFTPTMVDVYLSNDGITYDLVGSPLKANLTYASSYHYILFYKAIPAKYVRLRLSYSTSTNTQNLRVTELDVYAN